MPDASALGVRTQADTWPLQTWQGHSMVFQRGEEAVVRLLEAGNFALSTTGIHNSEGYNLPTRHHGQYAAVESGPAERDSSDVLQDGPHCGPVGVRCFAKRQKDGREIVDSRSECRHWIGAVMKHDAKDV